MKKILFLLFIPIILFAQNTDKTAIMQSLQQYAYRAFENTAEVFRVKIVSGSFTISGIDSVEVNVEELNTQVSKVRDSLNVLNNTQRIIRGYISSQLVKSDTSNARLSVANSILQDVEDRIAILEDSLNVLNATQLIIKGLLTINNMKLDSLKNDTELLRILISTLNGIVSTKAGQDSLKNDAELIRGLLTELRTSIQVIDDWDDGSDKANVNIHQPQNTTSLDTVISILATTVTQLPVITGCKEITITNLTSGATLRIGKDSSVATQGGIYWYGDSMYTNREANVSRFYAYADIGTTVRIAWGY